MSKAKNDDDVAAGAIGYGSPPVATRFQKGRSGNPKGRPRGAKGRRATVKRVLLETKKADPYRTGRPRPFTVLELTILLLKQLSAAGDQRAYRAYMDLERRFGHDDPASEQRGYLIVPEVRDRAEWEALCGADAAKKSAE
jgi:hypothetical protein